MIARTITATPKVELEDEREVDGRVIHRGELVAIDGIRYGRVRVDGRPVRGFRVLGFRGDEVHVFGAETKLKVEAVRVFSVDRIRRAR